MAKVSNVYISVRIPLISLVVNVNGHIESKFSNATGEWAPLKFVPDPYMRIHGMAPALNYGQQVLEGFKAFRMPGNPGGIALFRPDRHALRFQHSAKVLSMPMVPVEMFLRACRAVVTLNAAYVPPHESGGALYIRPQLYGSGPRFRPIPADEYTFCVFVVPVDGHLGSRPAKTLILDDFDRAAPKGTGHAKVGGNYAPVMRWSHQAKTEGFDITLHLDSARHEEVDEFSTCAFIGVRSLEDGEDTKNVTLVIPDSPCVIASVTSASVQHIASSWGWKVEKRRIPYTELPTFSEVFGAGTGLALLPIQSIARRRIDAGFETVSYLPEGQHSGGPVCLKLSKQLSAIQRGMIQDDFGWRFEIEPKDREIEGAK